MKLRRPRFPRWLTRPTTAAIALVLVGLVVAAAGIDVVFGRGWAMIATGAAMVAFGLTVDL